MKKLLVILSLCGGAVQAQKMPDPRPFAKTITAADLKKHLYIVASADFEGRETATEGQRKAAAYIENDFRSLGLQPGGGNGNYQLFYPVFQDSLEQTTLSVNGQTFTRGQDYAVPVTLNYTADLMAGDVVFAGYGISDSTRDDYKGLNVRGKIVLVLAGQPAGVAPPAGRRGAIAKQEAAQKNGAVAVLILTPAIPQRYLDPSVNRSLPQNTNI